MKTQIFQIINEVGSLFLFIFIYTSLIVRKRNIITSKVLSIIDNLQELYYFHEVKNHTQKFLFYITQSLLLSSVYSNRFRLLRVQLLPQILPIVNHQFLDGQKRVIAHVRIVRVEQLHHGCLSLTLLNYAKKFQFFEKSKRMMVIVHSMCSRLSSKQILFFATFQKTFIKIDLNFLVITQMTKDLETGTNNCLLLSGEK